MTDTTVRHETDYFLKLYQAELDESCRQLRTLGFVRRVVELVDEGTPATRAITLIREELARFDAEQPAGRVHPERPDRAHRWWCGMSEPIAYLVAERRDGQWLLDDSTHHCTTLAEAERKAAQWRALPAGDGLTYGDLTDIGILAVTVVTR